MNQYIEKIFGIFPDIINAPSEFLMALVCLGALSFGYLTIKLTLTKDKA